MLVLSRFFATFTIIGMFILYLFLNIKNLEGESNSIVILYMIVLLSFIYLFINSITSLAIKIKKSFFIMVLFFMYLLLSIVTTTQDFDMLKDYFIGTTGGIFLFYFLGVFVSLFISDLLSGCQKSLQAINFFTFFTFLFSCLIFYFQLETVLVYILDLRSDILLLENLNGLYQRPGDFLIVVYLIYSFVLASLLIIKKLDKKYIVILYFIFFIYLFNGLMGMFISQMIGSNNAFINIGFFLFCTTVLFILLKSINLEHFAINYRFTFKKIFFSKRKLTRYIYGSLAKSIMMLFVLLLCFIYFMDIDIYQLRIFGFGSGEITSISSRFHIWGNFAEHLNINPFFGNIIAEKLTTGEGTYIHSFIGSLLTHLGFFGLIVFFMYLIYAFKEAGSTSDKTNAEIAFRIYSLIVFSGMFVIASLGTFFSWIPLWFILGLSFLPIKFIKKKDYKND